MSVVTSKHLNSVFPLETALTRALLSAQMVNPYETFSTFVPISK